MIEKSIHQRPTLAGIVGTKQCGRFDAAEERVGIIWVTFFDLPDLFKSGVSTLGKLDVVSLGLGPFAAEIF